MAQETQELLDQISKDFSENCRKDKQLTKAYKATSGSNASYQDAAECADRVGEALAKAFKNNLSSAVLEDGRLSYEAAMQILEPILTRAYQMNALACEKVQETLNKAAGINIKAQTPELNRDRIEGFARRIGSEENYDDVAWILNEPVKTFSRSIVDDSIEANADFHYKSGLSPKIIRKAEANCCDWCAALEGEYDYPLEDTEVYRRHDNCRCVVDYKPGDGRVQNAHTKRWQEDGQKARAQRIEFSDNPPKAFYKRSAFNTYSDPLVEVMGTAEQSHPDEIKKLEAELKEMGVGLVRESYEKLGYSPALFSGSPGTVYISENASFGAWLHEMQHVYDDRNAGWSGFRILEDVDECVQREINAYKIEIEMANKLGYTDIASRLEENLNAEIERLRKS